MLVSRPKAASMAVALPLLLSCTAMPPPPPDAAPPPRPASARPAAAPDSSVADVDAFVGRAFALDLVPGMAVAVVRDGEVVLLRGLGHADVEASRPVTSSTVFYIASATKSFTALAAALLHADGVVDLDAPVTRYLPAAKVVPPAAIDRITLRRLLTHTHGISDEGPITFRTAFSGEYTSDELLRVLVAHPTREGADFVYGNVGYVVASLALDAATRQSWKDVLEQRIFGPLGMRATGAWTSRTPPDALAMPYRAEPRGFARVRYAKGDETMHAAGGLVSTAEDLARWLQLQLARGRLDGRQLVPEALIEQTHAKHADQDDARGPVRRSGYALGWQLGTLHGEPLVHHLGSFAGFFAHVSFMPGARVGLVVLCNEDVLGSDLADAIASYAYARLAGRPEADGLAAEALAALPLRARARREGVAAEREKRAARSQQLPHARAAYAGVYENPWWGRMSVRVVEDRLEVSMGRAVSTAEVFDAAQSALRVELAGRGQVARFEVRAGRAVAVELAGVKYARIRD